jgi:hypothetical protein
VIAPEHNNSSKVDDDDNVLTAKEIVVVNEDLLRHCCFALGMIASQNDACRRILLKKRTVELVLRAMRKFPYSQDVQRTACLTLAHLTKKDACNEALLDNHAVQHLLMALRNHMLHESVLLSAFKLMANLAFELLHNTDRVIVRQRKELCRILSALLQTQPKSLDVTETSRSLVPRTQASARPKHSSSPEAQRSVHLFNQAYRMLKLLSGAKISSPVKKVIFK